MINTYMKIYEVVNPRRAFSTKTTGMPLYDNMLKNPEYFEKEKGIKFKLFKTFPPSKYIDRCAKGQNTSREQLLVNRADEKIDDYAAKLEAGETFPLPVLDYTHGFSQEGLHRAFAAEKVGLQQMPYMVVDKV